MGLRIAVNSLSRIAGQMSSIICSLGSFCEDVVVMINGSPSGCHSCRLTGMVPSFIRAIGELRARLGRVIRRLSGVGRKGSNDDLSSFCSLVGHLKGIGGGPSFTTDTLSSVGDSVRTLSS